MKERFTTAYQEDVDDWVSSGKSNLFKNF